MQVLSATDYATARPFPFTVLDGLDLPFDVTRAGYDAQAIDDWPAVVYDNPLEKKRVVHGESVFSHDGELASAIRHFHSPDWLSFLEDLTGIQRLRADPSFHGAGLSIVERGGFLALHRDLETHPKSGLRRALNLALFLSPEWQDEWGGHLELWGQRAARPWLCGRRVRPKFGRVVLFDPQGWHGFPDGIQCPEDVKRISLQLFYYVSGDGDGRRRAFFATRPEDDAAAMLNNFRDLMHR